MMMLAMTMVMPASTWAQVMYTVFNNGTLTFMYGEKPESGTVYDVPTDPYTAPGWLAYKESIETVDFDESFKNARPTSCSHWFYGFSNLMSIQGIENLNTEEVKNMSCMFYSCQKLTSLDVSKFNTDKVKNMSFMFSYCSGLTSLDLSSFNTAEVENMSCMFSNCSGLSSLDVSKFNTAKVTDMSGMLKGCKKLSSLDLSSFNTAKVMYMNDMFNYCSGLLSLDLSSFNTAEVTNMNDMFNYCSGLDNLDLSSFNTAKVTEMGYMFYGCSKLTTIYVSDDFTIVNVTYGSNMFSGCTSLKKGDVSYDSGKTGIDMANYKTGYFTESNLTPYVKWNADTKVLTFKVANYIEGTQGEWKLNEGDTYPGWSGYEVTEYCTNVVFTPSFKQAKPTSCYMWFWGFGQLTTIEGIENLNTEEVTNMNGMFGGCSGLTSLDVSKFNTAKVTNMMNMFNGCSDLTSLDVSSFNTAKVTNMSCMFGNCTGLKSLDLSSFNTAKVTDMRYMFPGCSGLTTIYVSDDFKIGNGTNGYDMFSNCTSLVGAAPYDPEKTDHTMANYTSGYFKTYFTLGENKMELCGEQLTTNSLNLDLSGEKDFVAHAPFTANKATYYRDLSSSNSTWFSLCLPFAYTPDNFTAYQLQSASADAVEIEEMTGKIVAGTPVLFKFKDGANKEINISATDAQIVKAPVEGAKVNGTDGSSLQLCGTYQTKTFSTEDNNAFILLNDKLMNPARMLTTPGVTGVSVKPFRAYMTLTASAQTSSARAFSIGHGGEEGTAAIDLLNSVATDDAEYYDINGRRIDAPAKGVNIVRRGNKTMKLIIK